LAIEFHTRADVVGHAEPAFILLFFFQAEDGIRDRNVTGVQTCALPISYNKRNETELIGFDKHFAPTCLREHSYRYDSYDAKYETLKYTQPKECSDCPLANEGICQKVFKMKITKDLRRYTAPARGSQTWQKIYNRRTAVEIVNAYLK